VSAPRLLILAGGTGGHVFPALAVAQAMAARGWRIDWVGTDRDMEARVVPAAGFTLHPLSVLGLRGKGLGARLRGFCYLLVALFQALRLVARLRPNSVLGMGGYAAGPAGVAAWFWRRPLVIHEQNAVAGTTNRYLAPLARQVLCGLPGAFPRRTSATWVGNPLRKELLELLAEQKTYPIAFSEDRPMNILVLGGSLGSLPLNRGVPAIVSEHLGGELKRIRVRHQCGAPHLEMTTQAWAQLPQVQVDVTAFIDDMASAYRWADVVICRAGALTVSELMAAGCPAMLIPLPHAIDDHQTANANVLVQAGAGWLVPQADMASQLGEYLVAALDAPSRLQSMSTAAQAIAPAQATEYVVASLEEVAHGS
jgi:UDP-N-acetylglucosamine--N-acetylmuramyl-(pentapeptide) pyrophosphoryl-undecaprenol N-acetylglucosamine transferase